jgi:hypothetical protein
LIHPVVDHISLSQRLAKLRINHNRRPTHTTSSSTRNNEIECLISRHLMTTAL